MPYDSKTIQFHLAEGEKTISINYLSLQKPFGDVKELLLSYPKGCMLILRDSKFTPNQLFFTGAPSCGLLLFDEKGKFVSEKIYSNQYDAPFSLLIQELFVFILPPNSELIRANIQSMEIVVDEYDVFFKNKYGVYEFLNDQCNNKTCTCEKGCRLDDMIFEESYMHDIYLANMRKAKKKDQDSSENASKNNDKKKLDDDSGQMTLSELIDHIEEKTKDNDKEIKPTIENFLETSNESIKNTLLSAYKKVNNDKKILQESNAKFLDLLKQERQIRKAMADQKRLTEFMKAIKDEIPMTKKIWSWWRNRY